MRQSLSIALLFWCAFASAEDKSELKEFNIVPTTMIADKVMVIGPPYGLTKITLTSNYPTPDKDNKSPEISHTRALASIVIISLNKKIDIPAEKISWIEEPNLDLISINAKTFDGPRGQSSELPTVDVIEISIPFNKGRFGTWKAVVRLASTNISFAEIQEIDGKIKEYPLDK
jgi:hypothetical protein